jgi:hypothetical protein
MTVQTGRIRKAHELHASGNDLFLKAGGLTTPFTTQNRPKAACDSIGLHDAIREIASIIRDYCDSEGSGEDVRRTSYTLPPKRLFSWTFPFDVAMTISKLPSPSRSQSRRSERKPHWGRYGRAAWAVARAIREAGPDRQGGESARSGRSRLVRTGSAVEYERGDLAADNEYLATFPQAATTSDHGLTERGWRKIIKRRPKSNPATIQQILELAAL